MTVLVDIDTNQGYSMHELTKLDNDNFFAGKPVVTNDRGFGLKPEFQYVSHENAATHYLATLGSKTSRATVHSKLRKMAQFFGYQDIHSCDWDMMHYDNVIIFLAHLRDKEGLESNTINGYLCALKGVAQTAWSLGQISDHDLMRIKSIKQLRSYKQPAGRALTERESRAMLKATEGDSRRVIRDRAILMLLLGCGLRRAEVTTIEVKKVFMKESRIRIVGKGNKERDVFMPPEIAKAVQAWIDLRLTVLREWNTKSPFHTDEPVDSDSGYLFGRWTRHYANIVITKPMTPWSVWNIVEQYKKESGCPNDISTHDLRRTFATRMLDKGTDISVVKNLMGHANIGTTAIYDRRGEEAMKKAMETDIL